MTDAPARPGLPLRVLRFPLTLLVIEAVVLVIVMATGSIAMRRVGLAPDSLGGLVASLAIAVLVILAWKALLRWVEGQGDVSFAPHGMGRELGGGLLLGFGLFTVAALVVTALGGMTIEGVRGLGQIRSMLAMAIISGVFEEALFRGVLFRHIETMLGSWAALAITSALFGAAHLANPDSSPFAAVAIAVEAGVLLGAAYMLTRRLWLAVGIHAAWNFTQGWVFSIPVSGGRAPLGLLITRRDGAEWLTGGDFGLEASVVALVVATAGGLWLLRRAIRQGAVRPPMWAAARTA